jgi:hypothetical protein
MINERIKFYADTPMGEKNKQFCFKTDILNLSETIKRFLKKGFNIRAAWYEKINTVTRQVENTKIPTETIQKLFFEVEAENKNSFTPKK